MDFEIAEFFYGFINLEHYVGGEENSKYQCYKTGPRPTFLSPLPLHDYPSLTSGCAEAG